MCKADCVDSGKCTRFNHLTAGAELVCSLWVTFPFSFISTDKLCGGFLLIFSSSARTTLLACKHTNKPPESLGVADQEFFQLLFLRCQPKLSHIDVGGGLLVFVGWRADVCETAQAVATAKQALAAGRGGY